MKAMMKPKKKTQAIGFPSLITKLCLVVGLSYITDPAERVPLIVELSWKTFNKPPNPLVEMPQAVVAIEWRKGWIKKSKLRRRPKVNLRAVKRKREMMRDLNCTL